MINRRIVAPNSQQQLANTGPDWSNWQNMPDYRQFIAPDKNKSFIAQISAYLDPHSSLGYMPVFKDQQIFRDGTEFYNQGQDAVWTTANRVLEPVMKLESKLGNKTDPVRWSLGKTFPDEHKGFTEWVNTHGADAAAIAAATYFTAGAAGAAVGSAGAGGAAAGAGATAAPAASGAAGAAGGTAGLTAAGTAAITPAFESAAAAGVGAGVTAGAGASAITPAFGAAGLSLAPEVAAGGLGAAGTAAANSMLTPAFASWGGSSGAGLLSSAKNLYSKFSKVNDYQSNLQTVANTRGRSQAELDQAHAAAIGDKILNSNQPQTYRQKVANQIMINRFGTRRY